MNKFSVDYEHLDKKLHQKKFYRYQDVKDHLIKVAFDVVRFRDSDEIDGLWKIEHTDDGDMIVAMYENPKENLEAKSSWSVVPDKTGIYINLFYKNDPIVRLASSDLGIPKDEISSIAETLPNSLASNINLRKSLFKELSKEERLNLFSKYPELNE